MAKRLQCPECHERFPRSDQDRGLKARCPECRHVFRPDEDEGDEEANARPRRREADDRDRRPVRRRERSGRPPRIPLPAWIAGGSIAALLLGVGLYLGFRSPPKPIVQPVAVRVEIDNPNLRAPIVVDNPNPNPNLRRPPINPVPLAKLPVAPPTPEQVETATAWSATADPSVEKPDLPAKMERLSVPLASSEDFFLPSSPSPFFGIIKTRTTSVTVWDIRNGQPTGTVAIKDGLSAPLSLSVDGKYLAGRIPGLPIVEIYDVTTNRPIRRFVWKGAQFNWLDFGVDQQDISIGIFDYKDHMIQVWNIASGKLIRSITLPNSVGGIGKVALSPGRQFVAFTARDRVWVYGLIDGKCVGSRPCPLASAVNFSIPTTCGGLAFSPDGTELAGLFESGGTEMRLLGWNVDAGSIAFNHDISDALGSDGFSIFRGAHVEYAPDGQALLVRGRSLVERQTGALLMQIPVGSRNLGHPLRLLPNDALLMAKADKLEKTAVVTLPFDRPAYEVAVQSARSAKATPPEPVKPNRSEVEIIAAVDKPAWAVTSDAAATPKLAKTVPLTCLVRDVKGIWFGAPESGRAALICDGEGTTAFGRPALHWNNLDLARGTILGSIELESFKKIPPAGKIVAALSPKGDRLAIRSLADPNRIDIWTADGKRLAFYLPSATGSQVDWLEFVSEDSLLTLSGGKLTRWEVPACKAVYEMATSYKGRPSLSPNRRWLAAFNGDGFDFINSATGAVSGNVPVEAGNREAPQASAAFSSDGSRFAGLAYGPLEQALVVCNVATGKVGKSFALRGSPQGDTLRWCGRRQLIHGSTLIDLDIEEAVWRYSPGYPFVPGTGDGTVWSLAMIRGNPTVPGMLAATAIPDTAVSQTLAAVRLPAVERILGSGAALSIRSSIGGPPGDAEFSKRTTDQLAQALQKRGYVVRDGAPLTLSLSSTDEDSADTYEIKALKGKSVLRTFKLRKVTGTMTLTDGKGRVIFRSQQVFNPYYLPSRIVRDDENPQKMADEQTWSMCSAWMAVEPLPLRAYSIGGNLLLLPGNSLLNPGP